MTGIDGMQVDELLILKTFPKEIKKKPSVVCGRLVVIYVAKFKKSLSSHGTSLLAECKKPQNDYIHRGA